MDTSAILPPTRTCLNGWWDFQPVLDDPLDGTLALTGVPVAGWHEQAVLVPGWWTKHRECVRRPGERFYVDARHRPVEPGDESLYDGMGYPVAWATVRAGWLRRTIEVAAPRPGRRRQLILEGLTPRGWLYLNGTLVAEHEDPAMPLCVDVEDHLRIGVNDIAVRIADFRREGEASYPGRGHRTMVPLGNAVTAQNSGLWQDTWLVERGTVQVGHVRIRTSVRRGELDVRWELVNAGSAACTVDLHADVVRWARDRDPATGDALVRFPTRQIDIPAQTTVAVDATITWDDAPLWDTDQPQLLELRTSLGNCLGELHRERFGFREVWIDGPDLMLNGHPVHLATEWGHRFHPGQFTETYVRQWLGMMRDANLNHLRLFSLPNPPLILEIADELGFLVTGETALNGAGGDMAADQPEFWVAAQAHVRRFLRRDGNHPSVILWSTGNEMRWNQDRSDLTVRELPRLRLAMQEQDPTRITYHDGDSSLWPECGHGPTDQRLLSRHYGRETSGLGWWDKAKPLHSGEVGVWHYQGPNNVLHLAGDRGFASFAAADAAGDEDALLTIEAGRSNGTTAFGLWNLSCLMNLRDHDAVRLDYADWSTPGHKPVQVLPQSAEFRFWEGGKGYTPLPGFALMARAFRPLALIDRGMRTGWCGGAEIRRTLHVVNDTPGPIAGELAWRISVDGTVLSQSMASVTAERGRIASVVVATTLPRNLEARITCTAELRVDGQVRDGWSRTWLVSRPRTKADTVAVWGDGSAAQVLAAVGAIVQRVGTPGEATVGVLIVERGTLRPGADVSALHDFASRGGRVLVLEQEHSIFPGHALEPRPVSTSFIRDAGHPLFSGLDERDLRFWGDDSFARFPSDTIIADRLYAKGDGSVLHCIADSGEGSFGDGHLAGVVVSGRVGRGLIVGCQYRLTDKAAEHPAAGRLLANLLAWLNDWTEPAATSITSEGSPADLVARARAGGTVVVGPLDEAGIAAWAAATGLPLRAQRVSDVWQIIRGSPDPLQAGISDEDPCGIENWTYCPPDRSNIPLAGLMLAPCAGVEALWETPVASGLFELFVMGGRAESLRAHTRTQLYANPAVAAVAVGRIRCGAGVIILNQYAASGQLPRLARLGHQLRANLGAAPNHDAITTVVPASNQRSAGYPVRLTMRQGPLQNSDAAALLAAAAYNPERMLTRAVLRLGSWNTSAASDGVFTVTGAGERWLYLVIDSPTLRRTTDTNLGVPNPGMLTFCDVAATGSLRMAINGRWWPEIACVDGRGTIADVALEQGFNHVLIRWTGGGETIALRFRNIVREAETGFAFP